MKKFLLALVALACLSTQAFAQNPTCPTRPAGDVSNACASTAFVGNSTGAFGTGVSVLSSSAVKCDNVTNDSAAIQAVLTANAGSRVYIPPGRTCLANGLTLPDGTTFTVIGSTLASLDTASNVIAVGNRTILNGEAGGTIDGRNGLFFAADPIACLNKTDVIISGLIIQNSLNYGIVADDCNNVTVEHNVTISVAYNLLLSRIFSRDLETLTVRDNTCNVINSAPIGAGCAYVQAPAAPSTFVGKNISFVDNTCIANTVTLHAAACVTIFNNTGRVAGTFVNVLVQGNLSYNIGWGSSVGGLQNSSVNNNVTKGASDICIEAGFSVKTGIVGNVCELSGNSIGLSVIGNAAMVFDANIIRGSQQAAILEQNSGGTSVISNNNISVAAGTGIYSDGPSNTITGNMINGNFAGVNAIDTSAVGGTNQIVIGNSTIAWTGTPIVVGATTIICGNTTLGCPIGTVTTVNGVSYPASYSSGGIPYAIDGLTIGSSGTLAANQVVLGGGAGTAPATLGSLGTATTLLHGNAAGAPTFGAVSLTADVSGRLPFANLAQGTARSVLGVTGNATADFASIQGTASQFLGVNSAGTALAFQSAAALTKTDDTNVTLTLGGTPTTAVMSATSITAGWTGTLAVGRGGTGLASGTSGGIPYFSSTSTIGSSALLTTHALMVGGGAANPPTVVASLGTSTTLLHGAAAGDPTFGAVVSGDLNITGTTCTNQFVTAISSAAAGTCTTDTLAGAQHANQGTTTTVLHGNGAGNPSWAAVSLTADVSGITPSANGGTGVNNGSSTITVGGNVTYSGAFASTMTMTNTTNSTFPAGTHTLAGLDVAQTWSALQGFNSGDFKLNGATSGSITINAAATAGSNTLTLPAGTTDFSATGGTSQVVKQTSSGGALTVARLACSDLSDGATGCSTAHTEGTWTPTLLGASTPGTGQTYLTQVGSYETNGRQVTARFTLNLSGLGTAAGNARIGGLPFTSTATSNDQGTCVMGYYSVSGLTASTSGITGLVPTSGTVADLYSSGGAGASAVTITQVGASALLIGICQYRT